MARIVAMQSLQLDSAFASGHPESDSAVTYR